MLTKVTARWRQLLSSETALESMNDLHPSTVEYLEKKMPFSAAEEALISSVSAHQAPSQQKFQSILESNRKVRGANNGAIEWEDYLQMIINCCEQLVRMFCSRDFLNMNSSNKSIEIWRWYEDDSFLDISRYSSRVVQRSISWSIGNCCGNIFYSQTNTFLWPLQRKEFLSTSLTSKKNWPIHRAILYANVHL